LLLHSKLRSWLTIIGIVIGVGAVVGIISLGDNMQEQVQSKLASIDLTNIFITPGYSKAQLEGPGLGRFGGSTTTIAQLTNHDIDALRGVEGMKYVTGEISGREDVSFNGENASLSINGVDPQVWKYMNSLELESGRLLEPADMYITVIGSGVASGIYKKDIGVNQIIAIKGKSFRVVGVLKEKGGNEDRQIYRLYEEIYSALGKCGFEPDKKFHPHITLGRVKRDRNIKLKNLEQLNIPVLEFNVNEFYFMESPFYFWDFKALSSFRVYFIYFYS